MSDTKIVTETEAETVISIDMLKSNGACAEGMRWVEKNLPDGAPYSEFIQALERADHNNWADWLIEKFGALVLAANWRIAEIIGATKNSEDSSGYYAQIGSSGDYAKIGSSGNYAKIGSSGYSAKIEMAGKNSIVACVSVGSIARADEGGCIALRWTDKSGRPRLTVGYVGEGIEAGVWYRVDDSGALIEVQQ